MAARAEIKADVKQFVEPLKTAEQQVQALARGSKKGASQLRLELRSAKKEVEALALAYSKLSAEEKRGDFGVALAKQLREAKKAAAELVDMQGDLQAELKHLASDTSTFDSLAEGFGVLGSVAQTTLAAFASVTGESEQMKQAMAAVVAIETSMNAVIKIQNALQQQSSLMLGIKRTQELAAAAAVKIKTAAENKGVITTKAATAAQKIFNAVAYANPYVLLAAAILAAGAALLYFATRTKEATTEEKRLQESTEALKSAWESEASRLAENVVKFKDLQTAWNDLGDDLNAKKQFVKDNADKFKDLGLNITDVTDCERVMVKNSPIVIQSFEARAKAAAAQAAAIEVLTKYYIQLGEIERKIKNGEKLSKDDFKAFNLDPRTMKGLKQKSTFTGPLYEVTDPSAILNEFNNAVNKQTDAALKTFNKIKKEQDALVKNTEKTEKALQKIEKPKKDKNKPKTTKTTKTTNATKNEWDGTLTSIESCNKAIQHHEKQIKELKKDTEDYDTKVRGLKDKIVTAAKAKFSLIDASDLNGMKEARSTIELIIQNLDKNSPELKTWADGWRAADNAVRATEQQLENLKNGIEEGSLTAASQDVERFSSQINKLNISSLEGAEAVRKLQNEVAAAQSKVNKITIKTTFIENKAQAKQVLKDVKDYEKLIKELPMTNSAIDAFEGYINDAISKIDINMEGSTEALAKYIKLLNELENKRFNIEIKTNILTGQTINVNDLTKQIYDKQKSTQVKNAKEYEANVRAEWKQINETTASGIDEVEKQIQFWQDRKKDIFAPNQNGLGDMLPDIATINKTLKALTDKKWEIELRMQGLDETSIKLMKFKKSFEDVQTGVNALSSITDGISAFSDSINKMSDDLENGANGFTIFTDAVNIAKTFIETLSGTIESVVSMIQLFGAARQATAQQDTAATQQEVANSIAKTTANSGEAITEATKQGAKLPFPANIAAIAAGVAAVVAALAMITQFKFAQGGIVGGSTTVGDTVVGRLNKGEMVLNAKDQNYLYNYIHKRKLSTDNGGMIVGKVNIKGTDLELVLSNLSKKKGLSGKSLAFK